MAKDPAFLFYTGDFTTGTQFFSDEQVGKYLRLLMAQHQHGHLTEQQVNFICKSYDNEVMKKFTKDANGLYFNQRLEVEILKRKSYSESRGNNRKGVGTKGVKPPKEPKKTSKSYDFHMENENEIKNEFREIIKRWLDYKKSRGETYKNRDSILTMYRKLIKFSNEKIELANQIIENAIGNNYSGFFELKNQNQKKQLEVYHNPTEYKKVGFFGEEIK